MRLFPLLLTAALFMASGPARAQESRDAVADELAGIGRTLERIAGLLEAAEVRQEADLLLRRIALMERRIAPLQGRVSETRSEVDGIESELRHLQAMDEEFETAVDDAIREGTDQPDSPERNMLAQVKSELKRLAEQLEIAELRKRQAEDALADAREDIEVLDDMLLDVLERRRKPRP